MPHLSFLYRYSFIFLRLKYFIRYHKPKKKKRKNAATKPHFKGLITAYFSYIFRQKPKWIFTIWLHFLPIT